MNWTDQRAQVLANCKCLYGIDTEVFTFSYGGLHQAIATRFDPATDSWTKLLHGRGPAICTNQALQELLAEAENELAKLFRAGGISVPFSGDPAQTIALHRGIQSHGASSSVCSDDFVLIATPRSTSSEEAVGAAPSEGGDASVCVSHNCTSEELTEPVHVEELEAVFEKETELACEEKEPDEPVYEEKDAESAEELNEYNEPACVETESEPTWEVNPTEPELAEESKGYEEPACEEPACEEPAYEEPDYEEEEPELIWEVKEVELAKEKELEHVCEEVFEALCQRREDISVEESLGESSKLMDGEIPQPEIEIEPEVKQGKKSKKEKRKQRKKGKKEIEEIEKDDEPEDCFADPKRTVQGCKSLPDEPHPQPDDLVLEPLQAVENGGLSFGTPKEEDPMTKHAPPNSEEVLKQFFASLLTKRVKGELSETPIPTDSPISEGSPRQTLGAPITQATEKPFTTGTSVLEDAQAERTSHRSGNGQTIVLTILHTTKTSNQALNTMVNLAENTKAAIIDAVNFYLDSKCLSVHFPRQRRVEIRSGTGKKGDLDLSAVDENKWWEYLEYLRQYTTLPELTVDVVELYE